VSTRRELQVSLTGQLGSAAEARFVLDDVLGRPSGRRSPAAPLSAVEEDRVHELARQRLAGAPLQYVLGHWAFRQLDVRVDERVLVPRPETEQVVEVALAELAGIMASRAADDDRPPVVVDLGTGSGVIALSVASEAGAVHPRLRVVATDVDPGALEVARDNRQALGAVDAAAAERMTLRRGSWWQALPAELRGRVDLVISNPPYVAEDEWPALDPEVRREPRRALVAPAGSDGTPGLADLETVLAGSPAWLTRPGAVVVELSPPQVTAARAVAWAAGAAEVTVALDLAGRPRTLVARFT
jgi:release factor glutamine methyltransferase